ncbi:hypothetical protein H0H92_016082 [Tricholoma furcatifolium]|nr:hypothetical protein H0H92_016082 [Tricholoma furcatifolium]
MANTHIKRVDVKGVKVFYREAGKKDASTILLLHGFPTSSFQYRNLIERLAPKYRVIAPDLPGFGFTDVPAELNYKYTFDNLAATIIEFTKVLGLNKFAVYIFDYGAPTGLRSLPTLLKAYDLYTDIRSFRLALARPEAITAIISQNGNAFEAGLTGFWDQLRVYWEEPTSAHREPLRGLLTADVTKFQYVEGEAHPELVPPETWTLDYALLSRPGNQEIQLDLFYDYRNNVTLYPKFHEYFKQHKPPVLAVWGKNDPIFSAPGAEAFKIVLPAAEVHLVDGGHFPLENHLDEVHGKIEQFLSRHGI